MVDPLNGPIWSKNFVLPGVSSWNTFLYDKIIFTSDSNFIVSGKVLESNSSKMMASLMKITPIGDTLWTRTYNQSTIGNCLSAKVIESNDSNYVIAWADDIGTYLRKVDPMGNTLWARSYASLRSDISSFKQASDSSLYLTSTTYNNTHLLKLNALGQFVWMKEYADHEVHDCELTDDNIFLLMRSSSSQTELMKLDTSGTAVWHQMYTNTWADFSETPNRFEILSDSSIVFLNSADYGSFLGKTDSMGIMTGQYLLELRSRDILERDDKGLAIVGNGPIYGIKVQYETHIGVIHLDSLFQGDCIQSNGTPTTLSDTIVPTTPVFTESGSSSEINIPIEVESNGLTAIAGCVDFMGELNENDLLSVHVYPTISASEFHFEWEQPGTIELEIHDTQGRKVYSCSASDYSIDIDLSSEKSGVYFFTATHENGRQASDKLIKQ